jgi:23S rRNA pseudouridine2605 synthase
LSRLTDDKFSPRAGRTTERSRKPRSAQPRSRPDSSEEERLQKVLARAGFGSRRACEELIASGRVSVNGETATLGRRVDVHFDQVEVDGARIGGLPQYVHYLLNKPTGVVTSASDPHGRRTVADLVPRKPRAFPVGRLDTDTEGLLIVTNDGDLAQRLSHPSFGVEKEYLAKVEGVPRRSDIKRLRDGVELDDGRTAPAKVSVVGDPADGVLRISIHEGRNRQVRRMCEAVGHRVSRLVRVRIGPVRLRDLQPGEWRKLSAREVHALGLAAGSSADKGSHQRHTGKGGGSEPAPRVRSGGRSRAGR